MPKRYFIAKYALTAGIQAVELAPSRLFGDELLVDLSGSGQSYRAGVDVFEHAADALADAEKRRAKKLKSLRGQIAKLEALVFEVPK